MTVVRWLWRLSVATALALLGLSITTAAVLAAAPEATQIYTYDSPQHPAGSAENATERVPPAFHALDIAHDAVDQWSHSDSVRFDAPVAGSTTTYNAPPTLAQVARATSTTWGQAGTLSEHPLSLQRWHVAAKAVPETLNFGSRAAAREGLPGDLAAVGNRFFRGATGKSQDFQAVGLPGGGYRLQFYSPANNQGYGKLYVQEIDRGGNIVRRYKDAIGPDGFIERKFVQ